ncbi:MAG: hypothetical protein ACYC64_16765 [Armatimonadota bacterium]
MRDNTDGNISSESCSMPRSGWAEQFRKMAEAEDDKLIDDVTATTLDEDEWDW